VNKGGYVLYRGDRPNSLLARWLPHADWSIAILYLAVFWGLDLPSIRISTDYVHQTTLLMSCLRILDGQVPYRDFYPWYGPLFHYFAAFWVRLLGRDLLAVKLFIKVISPLLSLAMLIATLRMFRLDPWGRFFAVAASGWGVFELYFQTGATRTFFGLFLIGLWVAGLRQPRRAWSRALVFPSALLAFCYSPEVGFYLLPVGMVVAFFDWLQLPLPGRRPAWLAYGAGALLALGLFSAGYMLCGWFRSYVQFFLYTSSNMVWAYSAPLPELSEFFSSPGQWFHFHPWPLLALAGDNAPSLGKLLFFLPWLVLAVTAGWILVTVLRGKISQIPVWVPACVAYGAMLWTSTFLRMDGSHLLWALPPIMILLGKLFSRKTPFGAIKLALLALILWGWPFFLYAPPDTYYWKALGQKSKSREDWPKFSGVLEGPDEKKMYDALQAFIQAHPRDSILFPLHSYDAYRLGQPLLLPFNDLFWANLPERQEKLTDLMRRLNAPYLCLDISYFWSFIYVNEDVQALFDFIATHYQPVNPVGFSILYERLPEPRVLAQKILSDPGPIPLSKPNSFQTGWKLPDDFSGGYLEMNESFSYSCRFFQRFSRPLVKVMLDGQPLKRGITQGSARIRNTPEGGSYRIYVPRGAKKVTIQILFPGFVNIKPEAVTLKDVGLYKFNFPPIVPYTDEFLKDGY